MAFQRPAIKEIITRLDADAQSRLTTAQLRRSNAKVFTRVVAGAVHGLYGYIQWIHRQQFLDTAESEYLDRWASIYGLARKASSKASGTVAFSFSGSRAEIPSGTVLQSDDGVLFQTTDGMDPSGHAPIEALEAGAGGNLDQGDVLTLISPIAGVYSEAEAFTAISGGAEQEDDESLRSRLIYQIQEKPHGGTAEDYVRWALEVPGVTRAWCNPKEDGVGTVAVRFVCDNLDDILPTEEMLRQVAEYLETQRPVTAQVFVKPMSLKPVDITISGLLPDDSDVRLAVKSELRDLFTREAEPGGLVYLSHVRAAISSALGEEDHDVTSPAGNPLASAGELLVLGEITWV